MLLRALQEFAPHIPAASAAWYDEMARRMMAAASPGERERVASEYQGGRAFALFLINLSTSHGRASPDRIEQEPRPRRPRSRAAERAARPGATEEAP